MRSVLLLWILIETTKIIGAGHACPLHCSCKPIGAQAEWLKAKCEDHLQDVKEIDVNGISIELVQLDLSKNEIYLIESEVFKNLTNLRRLDLSLNKIGSLDEGSFEGLRNLERLDLSKNQISTIDTHAFRQLPNLKRLDLSGNKISAVEPTLFHDLLALDRLKLNQNVLTTLKEGAFHGLKSLKQLDLSSNPWECNCDIYWFSNWIHNSSIKLSPAPKCASPVNLRGQPMKKLRVSEEIRCQWATPAIEMLPDQNQVVFAGDSIKIKCRAPSITEDKDARLHWLWNPNTTEILDYDEYTDPRSTLSNIKVENRFLSDSGIVDSLLTIVPVGEEHNGQWNCQLVSMHGNRSKAISVIVISDETRYCPLTVTRNNKGIYAWPRTVVGWKVELPCEGSRLAGPMQTPLRATYRCNMTGRWEYLNTEPCPYLSHTTKVLEQFSKVNLSLTKGSLLETAKRLKNYTGDGTKLTDPIEIHFVTQTIENYLHFLVEEKELGGMLVDIVSTMMKLPREMLRTAEINDKSCTRLVKAVETITELTPSIQSHRNNMALEEFRVKRDSFTGLTCTWYTSRDADSDTKSMRCSTNNKTALINTKDKVIEASIQLPASLLMPTDQQEGVMMVAHQLMISMYSDNRLFPKVSGIQDSNMDIASCVVGSKLIGMTVANLSEPVYVMVKAPLYHYSGSRPRPVVWDATMNDHSGGWTSDGCKLSHLVNNQLIVFHCNRLGYYGLLQDTSFLSVEDGSLSGAKFRYSHPAIYVGSFIAITCLTCASVTYMIFHASILMPKKVKHCIVNTWVAIAVLCFLFSAGIQQTENVQICQGVGLVLHYLSLCSLLWMAVFASNMYKRLSKSDMDSVADDELPDEPIQKPVLGLYLVGWGVALIICGISGAINLREYAGYSHCFLTSGPALAALFVPAVILIVYLIIFHLLIRCAIRNIDLNAQLSEGTQATENMDLELLEPESSVNRTPDRNSIHTHGNSTATASSEVEDLEHSQITQLKGQIIVLILYLTMWISAASATANPLNRYIPHEETIFSILYAISASSLGLFILFFYGLARSDVRSQWMRIRFCCCCWLEKKKNRCCRTRSVSDTNPYPGALPTRPFVQNLAPISNSQATQLISDTNSINSSRHTHKSDNSNLLKGADLNVTVAHAPAPVPVPPPPGAKIANVNLVVLHRQQYRSNNSVTTYTEPTPASVEMFYNPHQSGVARKFFKKQRRHMKHNNLGPRKQGDGGATSDGGSSISIPRPAAGISSNMESDIFSRTTAKVNNTNIHVEYNLNNPMNDAKNVNILSDSGGSVSVSEERNIPIRFVIGQENLLRNMKKVNNGSEPRNTPRRNQQYTITASLNDSDNDGKVDLRNVSQQCSLEYSSEVECTQMASERSDHNLPEIGETPEPEKTAAEDLHFRCSSANEMSDMDEQIEPACTANAAEFTVTSPAPINHSNSLRYLSVDHQLVSRSRNHRRSLNDVASTTSSRNCENDVYDYTEFKYSPTPTDLQSVASSHLYDQVHHSQERIDCSNSQRSLVEINSLTSDVSPYTGQIEMRMHMQREGANSMLDLNSASSSCNTDHDFRPIREIRLLNTNNDNGDITAAEKNTNTNRSRRNSLTLDKDFNSLTDLTSINSSLYPNMSRHLDMNASIGVDYEDTNFSNAQHYTQDTAVCTDDEMYLENSSTLNLNVKKETSV